MDPSADASSTPPLSLVVITLNEEHTLARCVESALGLVREIVVLDSGSTDGTVAAAERLGARVSVQPWQGNVAQKNAALRLARQPWVLCLDADEWLSPELARSIRRAFTGGEPRYAGYLLNRLNRYAGVWIRHSWRPEWRLRLARAPGAEWRGLDPHGRLHAAGPTGRLRGDLLHESFASVADHFQKTIAHAQTAAASYAKAGRVCRWYHIVFSPWAALLKHLVVKAGWLDGWRGWVIAHAAFVGTLVKYASLAEQPPEGSDPPPGAHQGASAAAPR